MHAPSLATRDTIIRSAEAKAGRRHARAWVVTIAGLALVGSLLPAAVLAAATTHSISGSVKNTTGAAVAGIQASACYTGADGWTDVCSDATTGVDGAFTIGGLAPREYVVKLVDPAHAYPNGWYVTGGFTVDSGAATKLTVADADVTGIDAAYPAIFTMSGKVTAHDGTPMPDADVQPCLKDATGYCDLWTVAGAGGTFTFPVVAGTYVVDLADHRTYRTEQRFFYQPYREGGATSGDPTVIPVAANVSGLDLRLQPASLVSGHVTGVTQFLRVAGCTAGFASIRESCHGGFAGWSAAFDYTIAVVPASTVVVTLGGAASALPGFWSRSGIVAVAEKATILDLTSANATGIDIRPAVLKAGIHAGTATGGSFGTKPVSVKKGMAITLKMTLAKGYAGTKVQVQAATLDAKGKPGTFKTIATKTVAANGTVVYATKTSKSMAYRARYVPPQEFIDVGVTQAVSAEVIAKVR